MHKYLRRMSALFLAVMLLAGLSSAPVFAKETVGSGIATEGRLLCSLSFGLWCCRFCSRQCRCPQVLSGSCECRHAFLFWRDSLSKAELCFSPGDFCRQANFADCRPVFCRALLRPGDSRLVHLFYFERIRCAVDGAVGRRKNLVAVQRSDFIHLDGNSFCS